MLTLDRIWHLAEQIHSIRNTGRPSEVLVPRNAQSENPSQPLGALLLKPSSGSIPVETIAEILRRLVEDHAYHVRSVVWWCARDLKQQRIMAAHYPGFYRVAHGGAAALAPAAREKLSQTYASAQGADRFHAAFGTRFDWSLVRTPYDLGQEGISPETLNQLWERDRSGAGDPLQAIQRLDDDSFALALRFSEEPVIPPAWRGRTVVLLNGFFAKLEKDFETHGCVAILIQRHHESSTGWEDLRTRFAGKTNPFLAAEGTVRGDAARGVLKVETVSFLANVIHLSATEAEGRREVEEVWWSPASAVTA